MIDSPSKDQGADLAVINHIREMSTNSCVRVEAIICRDVHPLGDGIPENHTLGVVAATNRDTHAGLKVKLPASPGRVANAAVVAEAAPAEESAIVWPESIV